MDKLQLPQERVCVEELVTTQKHSQHSNFTSYYFDEEAEIYYFTIYHGKMLSYRSFCSPKGPFNHNGEYRVQLDDIEKLINSQNNLFNKIIFLSSKLHFSQYIIQ